ncbi:hypothetical protein [Streptomyces sp. NPDC059122]|uniref:hypothetical protein n=1 Tax=Streptomyces sp. NPDC059122 TaxID=3346732 RepID=UPI0036C89CFB
MNEVLPVVSVEFAGDGNVVCLIPYPDQKPLVNLLSYASGEGAAHAVVFTGTSWDPNDATWAYAQRWNRDALLVRVDDRTHEPQDHDYPRPAERVVAAAADGDRAFFLVQETSGSLFSWALTHNGEGVLEPRPLNVPGVRFRHAVVENAGVPGKPLWTVYALDDRNRLWAIYQHDTTPFLEDGSPNWSPPVPIHRDVVGFGAAHDTSDCGSLFHYHIGREDPELRLEVQDHATGTWREHEVRSPGSTAFEVTRHRVEAVVLTAEGVPVPNCAVEVTTAPQTAPVEVTWCGHAYRLSGEPTRMTTDPGGRVTLILVPTGLAAPRLLMRADGLDTPFTVQPALAVHRYLAGQGRLNPTDPGGGLDAFNGKVLANATTRDSASGPLAPRARESQDLADKAATSIQKAALLGMDPGRAMTDDELGSGLITSHTKTSRAVSRRDWSDGWDSFKRWVGSTVRGIGNGVTTIAQWTWDQATALWQLTVRIGEDIDHEFTLVEQGLETAGHFITNVFHQVEAAIEKVIDWLKAMFNFKDIWETKVALEAVLKGIDSAVSGGLKKFKSNADAWLTDLDGKIETALETLTGKVKGTSLNQLKRDNANPALGGGSAGTTSASATGVHHNWIMDKVQSANPTVPAMGTSTTSASAGTFATALMTAVEVFLPAATDAFGKLEPMLTQPEALVDQGLDTLISELGSLAHTAVTFAKAVLDAAIDLLLDGISAVVTLLTSPLDLGPLNAVWGWIADLAGHGSDSELTPAAVIALLAAFPLTIIYKLILGSDQAPFPGGKLPDFGSNPETDDTFAFLGAAPGGTGAGADSTVDGLTLAVGILTILYAMPVIAVDVLGDESPSWLNALLVGASLLVVGLGLKGSMETIPDRWQDVLPLIGVILQGICCTIDVVMQAAGSAVAPAAALMPLLYTGVGAICLVFLGIQIGGGNLKDGAPITAAISGTVPTALGFLDADAVKKGSADTIGVVKAVIDAVSYGTCGGATVAIATPRL